MSIKCKCDLHIVNHRMSVESFLHHVQSKCYTVEVCHNLIVYLNLYV